MESGKFDRFFFGMFRSLLLVSVMLFSKDKQQRACRDEEEGESKQKEEGKTSGEGRRGGKETTRTNSPKSTSIVWCSTLAPIRRRISCESQIPCPWFTASTLTA